jgi:hypothetical protein
MRVVLSEKWGAMSLAPHHVINGNELDRMRQLSGRTKKNAGRGVGTAGIARKWEGERRVRFSWSITFQ